MKSFKEFKVGEIYKTTFKEYPYSKNKTTLVVKCINIDEDNIITTAVLMTDNVTYSIGSNFYFNGKLDLWYQKDIRNIIKIS